VLQLGITQLIIDYVYLDIDERQKFAQFSHEYLVNCVKEVRATNINIGKYAMDIDIFYSTKELYWFIKENSLRDKFKLFHLYHPVHIHEITAISDNSNGTIILTFDNTLHPNVFAKGKTIQVKYSKYYDAQYDVVDYSSNSVVIKAKYASFYNYYDRNYGIIYNETNSSYFNPLALQNITFRGDDRTPYVDPIYYNYVVPYQYYSKTPTDGINSYSFALHPRKFQPSGSCNLSLINSKVLNIELMNDYYEYIVDNGLLYDIVIYGNTNNVLRITNGISSLVFSS
jgi:hypothetical protein